MKKILEILRMDVKIRTSHLWIVGLGVVVFLGCVIECGVAPFVLKMPNPPIEPEQLLLTFSLILGIDGARKVVLSKFKYLEDLQSLNDPTKKLAEEILRDKLWVPGIGWCLVFGFAVNMLIIPFFPGVRLINWSFLQAALAVFLTISGTREYGIYKKIDESEQQTMRLKRKSRKKTISSEETKTE